MKWKYDRLSRSLIQATLTMFILVSREPMRVNVYGTIDNRVENG